MQKNQLEVVVQSIRTLTGKVREYVLASVDGTPLPTYEAGAHIEMYLVLGDGPITRHYSLVGGCGQGSYCIAVQRATRQRGSAWLHAHAAVGTRLMVSRPKNHFLLDRRDSKSLLIAGGIGITPVLALLRSLVLRSYPFELLYVGRHEPTMAYLPEVRQLAGERAHIHCTGLQGHQRPDLQALLAAQPPDTTGYVCGPASMINSTHQAAAALGWATGRVRSELFTPPPTGDEVPFELDLKKSGLTLQVGQHTSILEAMTAAGLHPLFDCRRGECGLCPLPVLQADGPLQHRDTYLSSDEKASGQSLCICVSRVRGPRLVLNA